ncbi:50S ribosomal protein L7/L12-like [Schistocerca gregaria]|uniref:50S ribosomal protein L7/L12-like n=1 Tax=Schistocerca gregaria TaxID=7010 RepID=UPI00211ECDDB|nr:50S ribosomal protein L7/L12-like [Schistocerca gregaria]
MLLVRSRLVTKTFRNSVPRAGGISLNSVSRAYLPSIPASCTIARRYTVSQHPDSSYLEHPREEEKRISELKKSHIPTSGGMIDEPTERVQLLVKEILAMSFLEVAQLSNELSKRLGVPLGGLGSLNQQQSASAQPAAAAPAPEPPKAEEPKMKTMADVKLIRYQESAKFKVLKEIRNLKPKMNLVESKALIEGLPKIVMENLPYKEAEECKKCLTQAGAEVELV